MGGVSVGRWRNGAPRARTRFVTQRDHHAAAHSSGFKHLKSFSHGFAEPLLRGYFAGMPCYEHFVALQKSVFVPLVVFLVSHLGTRTGLYYIDSTALPVCDNHRISRHKVFADLAQRGKTSMGWFFGFKLHL